MIHDKNQTSLSRTARLSVRVTTEDYDLVNQEAQNQGLQISSFIIMLLVRCRILPESSLKKIKRRPVPYFSALHALMGIVNKIGGNCKQLAAVMPDISGLDETHASLIRAASAITDALQGKKIPEGVNLYTLQGDITKAGLYFNQIVKSVNIGNPNLAGLPSVLNYVLETADAITAALLGQAASHVDPHELIMEKEAVDMRVHMKQAADIHTKRPEDKN